MASSARSPAATASTSTEGQAARSRPVMSPEEISAVIVPVVASRPNACETPETVWHSRSPATDLRSARQARRSERATSCGSLRAIARVVSVRPAVSRLSPSSR